MKSHFLKIQFILIVSLLMCACTDDNEEGKKVTDYSEYTITVASMKLPGVLTSSGNNILADVYAVKDENSTEWEAHGEIAKFEYEEGYEYQIRISETSYLDYRMGDRSYPSCNRNEHSKLQTSPFYLCSSRYSTLSVSRTAPV